MSPQGNVTFREPSGWESGVGPALRRSLERENHGGRTRWKVARASGMQRTHPRRVSPLPDEREGLNVIRGVFVSRRETLRRGGESPEEKASALRMQARGGALEEARGEGKSVLAGEIRSGDRNGSGLKRTSVTDEFGELRGTRGEEETCGGQEISVNSEALARVKACRYAAYVCRSLRRAEVEASTEEVLVPRERRPRSGWKVLRAKRRRRRKMLTV